MVESKGASTDLDSKEKMRGSSRRVKAVATFQGKSKEREEEFRTNHRARVCTWGTGDALRCRPWEPRASVMSLCRKVP